MKAKEPKRKNEEQSKYDDKIRKRKSDNNLKNLCYYLYYLYLSIEPTTVIVINSNSRNGSIKQFSQKNYPCQYIFANGKTVFKSGSSYRFVSEDSIGMVTIQFDPKTHLPIEFGMSDNRMTANESRRNQQHILIQIINNYLRKHYHEEITFNSKRKMRTSTLSCLQMKSFPIFVNKTNDTNSFNITHQMNDKKQIQFVSFSECKKEYDCLVDAISIIIDTYLNKKSRNEKMLIIGDSLDSISNIKEFGPYIHLSRKSFFEEVEKEMNELLKQYHNDNLDLEFYSSISPTTQHSLSVKDLRNGIELKDFKDVKDIQLYPLRNLGEMNDMIELKELKIEKKGKDAKEKKELKAKKEPKRKEKKGKKETKEMKLKEQQISQKNVQQMNQINSNDMMKMNDIERKRQIEYERERQYHQFQRDMRMYPNDPMRYPHQYPHLHHYDYHYYNQYPMSSTNSMNDYYQNERYHRDMMERQFDRSFYNSRNYPLDNPIESMERMRDLRDFQEREYQRRMMEMSSFDRFNDRKIDRFYDERKDFDYNVPSAFRTSRLHQDEYGSRLENSSLYDRNCYRRNSSEMIPNYNNNDYQFDRNQNDYHTNSNEMRNSMNENGQKDVNDNEKNDDNNNINNNDDHK